METGSEEVDLKEEVKFEAVSSVCDHLQFVLYCVWYGSGRGGGGYLTPLGKITNPRNDHKKRFR